jgi:hypothetical protein
VIELAGQVFNIRDPGAKGNCEALDTAAVQTAIDACYKAVGGAVHCPPRRPLVGSIERNSKATLCLEAGAMLLASLQAEQYKPVDIYGCPANGLSHAQEHMIWANRSVNHVSFSSACRVAGWQWAVPTEDEWYRAAYYNPAAGRYYDHATSSNSILNNDVLTPDGGNNVNYYQGGYTIGSPCPFQPVILSELARCQVSRTGPSRSRSDLTCRCFADSWKPKSQRKGRPGALLQPCRARAALRASSGTAHQGSSWDDAVSRSCSRACSIAAFRQIVEED